MAADFSLLLGASLVVSLGLLAQMVRVALPRFAALKRELAECPATRELRFTVRETVVSWNDGTVVALFRKYEKNELNFQEWRKVSGKRMEGYLLSREPQFAAIIPLHRELLSHTERNEPQ